MRSPIYSALASTGLPSTFANPFYPASGKRARMESWILVAVRCAEWAYIPSRWKSRALSESGRAGTHHRCSGRDTEPNLRDGSAALERVLGRCRGSSGASGSPRHGCRGRLRWRPGGSPSRRSHHELGGCLAPGDRPAQWTERGNTRRTRGLAAARARPRTARELAPGRLTTRCAGTSQRRSSAFFFR